GKRDHQAGSGGEGTPDIGTPACGANQRSGTTDQPAVGSTTFAPSSLRTIGATLVPNNSIAFMILACGMVPIAICRRNRSFLNKAWLATIFSATCSGLPTNNAPSGPRA